MTSVRPSHDQVSSCVCVCVCVCDFYIKVLSPVTLCSKRANPPKCTHVGERGTHVGECVPLMLRCHIYVCMYAFMYMRMYVSKYAGVYVCMYIKHWQVSDARNAGRAPERICATRRRCQVGRYAFAPPPPGSTRGGARQFGPGVPLCVQQRVLVGGGAGRAQSARLYERGHWPAGERERAARGRNRVLQPLLPESPELGPTMEHAERHHDFARFIKSWWTVAG